LPALLKTSRLGYDGKGQATVTDPASARAAFVRFGEVACVLEERLELETELSVVLARGADGEVAAFGRMVARGEFGGLLDGPVGELMERAGAERRLRRDIGALRVGALRLLMEEADPAKAAMGLSRLALALARLVPLEAAAEKRAARAEEEARWRAEAEEERAWLAEQRELAGVPEGQRLTVGAVAQAWRERRDLAAAGMEEGGRGDAADGGDRWESDGVGSAEGWPELAEGGAGLARLGPVVGG
jgi:hypothetical protein